MFDPTTLTGFHTWLSLIGIAAGFVVLLDLIGGRSRPLWAAIFLITAIGTSVTGFLFPFNGVLPSHVVGVIALLVLVFQTLGLYAFGLAGGWRRIYAASAVISLYLLVFVGVAQAFAKIPALHAAAPTQAEPPFAIAQGIVLLIFVGLGLLAVRGFRPALRPAV